MFWPVAARGGIALAIFFGLIFGALAQSGTAGRPLKVGIDVDPPYIIKTDQTYDGIAIELWHDIARRGGFSSSFVEYPNPEALLAATAAGEVDIAIGNLTITREREKVVDFTQPWHDAGLRIMTDGRGGARATDIFAQLAAAGHLDTYLWLGVIMLVATLLLTLFDRRFDEEFPRTWFAGLVESFYHVMSVATSGSTSRKPMFGPFGRLFSALWLLCGVAVVAYVTSSVTSVMTAAAITDRIQSIGDLPGRTIGVLAGGASELYAQTANLAARPFDTVAGGAAALRSGEIDAMIADAQMLEYYVQHEADAGLDVVGPLFDPQKYGFALPPGSRFQSGITLDLLGAHEDGTIETLRAKYFGTDH